MDVLRIKKEDDWTNLPSFIFKTANLINKCARAAAKPLVFSFSRKMFSGPQKMLFYCSSTLFSLVADILYKFAVDSCCCHS